MVITFENRFSTSILSTESVQSQRITVWCTKSLRRETELLYHFRKSVLQHLKNNFSFASGGAFQRAIVFIRKKKKKKWLKCLKTFAYCDLYFLSCTEWKPLHRMKHENNILPYVTSHLCTQNVILCCSWWTLLLFDPSSIHPE